MNKIIAVLAIGLLSFQPIEKKSHRLEEKISGIIISAQDNKPIKNAHVFIVEGEEEAFTNEKGSFQLSTWQQLPIEVTITHPEFKNKKILISKAESNLKINLDNR